MTPQIEGLDHLVLTVASIEASCDFYVRTMGLEVVTFRGDRKALAFGTQKINLHPHGREYEPKAARPTPGSADLCFLSPQPVEAWMAHLLQLGVAVEDGPVERTGAQGPIRSIYFRDPDHNLIEVANPLPMPG